MKKKNLYLAIAAICLALVCAISIFFLNDEKLLIAGSSLTVFLIVSLILLYIHSSSADKYVTVLKNKYSADMETLKARLEKSEEIRSRYREILTQYDRESKEKETMTDEADQSVIRCYDDFRNNVVAPYLAYLKNVEMPLDSQARQSIIDATVDLAMQAVDVADASEWSINNRPEQKLNLDVVAQKKTKAEAYNEAIVITDNPAVTPKWIRALSASVKEVVSDSCMIIYSGYKR